MEQKKTRTGYRRLFTKAVTKINNILDGESMDRIVLQSLFASLSERYEVIKKLDYEILTNTNDDEIEDETDVTEEYTVTFHQISLRVKAVTEKQSQPTTSAHVGERCASCADCSHSRISSHGSSSVRLPKLSLPDFDGNILEWLPFWDAFKSAVDDNEELSGANKFDYLTAQLKGEAATLVKGFQHTSGSYGEAIKLLEKTYGDKQKIVRGHIYHIFDLESPRCNSKDLMTFRNEYESQLRSLDVLGIDVTAASHVYTALLTRKLPFQIRDNINRATRKSYLELDEFRDAIDEEIDRLNVTDEITPTERTHEYTHDSRPTISSFHTSIMTGLACHYCGQHHKAIDCNVYPTIEQRQNVIRSQRLCYNCLLCGHSVNQCRSPRTCMVCNAPHHTSICTRREMGDYTRVSQHTSSSNENTQLPTEGQKSDNASVNLIHSVTSTILPTAMVGVVSNGGVYYVRALFDQGAQRSFILNDVVDQLSLSKCGATEMTINGFNSNGKSRLYDVVHIRTSTNDGYVEINAIAMDQLPGNIVMNGRSSIVRDLQLRGIPLADPCVDDSIPSIQLIIGADHYFDYVPMAKINDIAIIPSRLGNMLSGRTPINASDNSTNTSGASLVVSVLYIGVTDDEKNTNAVLSKSYNSAVKDFESNNLHSGNGSTVRLPCKPNHKQQLPGKETRTRKRNRATLRGIPKIVNDTKTNGSLEMTFNENVTKITKPPKNTNLKCNKTVYTPVELRKDIGVQCFSNYGKLICLAVCVLMLCCNIRISTKRDIYKRVIDENPIGSMLSTSNVDDTEICIVKYIQTEGYPKELDYVQRDPPKSVKLLRLYDAEIRCSGHMAMSELQWKTTLSVLPPRNHAKKILICDVRRECKLVGVGGVLEDVEDAVNNRSLKILPLSLSVLLNDRNIKTTSVGDRRIELHEQTPLQSGSRQFDMSQEYRVALSNRRKHEYLAGLRKQYVYKRNKRGQTKISIRNIVLIHDDTLRINWHLGCVESLTIGNDREVRSVELKTQNGTSNGQIQILYPLECQVDSATDDDINDDAPSEDNADIIRITNGGQTENGVTDKDDPRHAEYYSASSSN